MIVSANMPEKFDFEFVLDDLKILLTQVKPNDGESSNGIFRVCSIWFDHDLNSFSERYFLGYFGAGYFL